MKKLIAVLAVNLLMMSGLSLFFYKKYEEVRLRATLGMFSAYCNRYDIRALQHYGKYPDGYPEVESVAFPPVCLVQKQLELLRAARENDFKLEEYYIAPYDTYFTGRNNPQNDKSHEKLLKELKKQIKEEMGLE